MNWELLDVQVGFRKGRGKLKIKTANICWIMEKAREFQKNMYFCFNDYTKAFDYVDHNSATKKQHKFVVHCWVQLFVTPWTVASQASLSFTISWSLLKLMFIESVMPSNHLILCRPRLLLLPIPPSIRVFPVSQLFSWGGQSIGVSASPSVLPMNTQDWSPLGWTGEWKS